MIRLIFNCFHFLCLISFSQMSQDQNIVGISCCQYLHLMMMNQLDQVVQIMHFLHSLQYWSYLISQHQILYFHLQWVLHLIYQYSFYFLSLFIISLVSIKNKDYYLYFSQELFHLIKVQIFLNHPYFVNYYSPLPVLARGILKYINDRKVD